MQRFKLGLAKRARLLLVVCGAGALLGYTGSWHWLAELFAHFFIQYWLISLLAFGVLLWAGDKHWAAAAALQAALLSVPLIPYFQPPADAHADAGRPALRVMQLNAAQTPEELFEWIASGANDFDVVVLLEASPDFQPGMERLRPIFPYALSRLQEGPYGIAILSKYPLLDAGPVALHGEESHAASARVAVPGWPIPLRLYAIHPPPPVGAALAGLRNVYLKQLAAIVAAQPAAATLVAGDMNITPWSPWFRAFLRATGLRDGQDGLGLLTTWPAHGARFSPGLGIPIDVSLHSADLRVAARALGPQLNTDHLPVITTLQLR